MPAPGQQRRRWPRRAVLVLVPGLVAASGLLAGCSTRGSADPAHSPDAEARVREEMTAALTATWKLAEALAATGPRARLREVLERVGSGHLEQLAAIGSPVSIGFADPGASASPDATSSPAGSPSAVPSDATPGATGSPTGPPPTARGLLRAELALAGELRSRLDLTGPELARAMARVAAGCAVFADLVADAADLPAPDPAPAIATALPGTVSLAAPSAPVPSATGTPGAGATAAPPPPGARAALGRLLAGEHAAVFSYGLITARVDARTRSRARTLWNWHMVHRDWLQSQLVAAGEQPPPAAPAYDVGPPPQTGAEAVALATRVEDALATLAARGLASAPAGAREELAAALTAAARHAAAWRGTPAALPG